MAVNNNKKTSNLAAGRIPHLGASYLTGLRKKCGNLIREISDELSELAGKGPDQDTLDQALRKSHGKPFAFDDGNMRSLHFDKRLIQSAMWLDAPDELALEYTKCMMAFLLANDRPKQILMIGLGGGSLVKFCRKYLPETRITVVEIDAGVIALRNQFLIPPDDELLQVVHMDALKFVDQNHLAYDVILMDGFDADGLVASLLADEFISCLKNSLSQDGILVTNLWSESKNLIALVGRMNRIFQNAIWWSHAAESYNLITFAFKSNETSFNQDLVARARMLDQHYWLDFENLAARLTSIPEASLNWLLSPNYVRPDLKNFFFQEGIARKVAYLLAADEMIALTHYNWLIAASEPARKSARQNDNTPLFTVIPANDTPE